jgi:hypothetical protein
MFGIDVYLNTCRVRIGVTFHTLCVAQRVFGFLKLHSCLSLKLGAKLFGGCNSLVLRIFLGSFCLGAAFSGGDSLVPRELSEQ